MDFETAHRHFVYREDGVLLRRISRGRHRVGAIVGGHKEDGYVAMNFSRQCYQVHRVIWLMHFGSFPVTVDHINGLRADNRIENLRAATMAENSANNHVVWGSTPLKGVTLHKQTGRYQASIRAKYIGLFDEPRDAAIAYDQRAVELFGAFACTNASLGLL